MEFTGTMHDVAGPEFKQKRNTLVQVMFFLFKLDRFSRPGSGFKFCLVLDRALGDSNASE